MRDIQPPCQAVLLVDRLPRVTSSEKPTAALKSESIGELGVLDTLAPAPSTKLYVPRAESVENPSPAVLHTESHYEFYNSAHGRQLDPGEQPASPIQIA